MQLLHTAAELDAWRATQPHASVAFVPTMGALHEGHLSLVRQARTLADCVIVSIFVNPKQFGVNEDFDRYPRTLEADCALLEGLADVVFAPTVDEVYPADVNVPEQHAGPVGSTFEGASRPGHFDGMLTVVSRLFDLVTPDVAVFGQKDAQQVFLVRQMITRRQRPIRLVVGPTQREADGLAMSSRNRYLSSEDRTNALSLNLAIARVKHEASGAAVTEKASGATSGDSALAPAAVAREAGLRVFEEYPLVRLDYLDLVDPQSFQSVSDDYRGPAIVIVAAKVGTTRLIDTDDVHIR